MMSLISREVIRFHKIAILISLLNSVGCVIPYLGDKPELSPVHHSFTVHDVQFLRSMGNVLGPPLIDGNKVEAFQNGDQIFPAMLNAIKKAKRSISFETYIYWKGDIGQEFADALSERARAGVKVHVILDWYGTQQISSDAVEEMTNSGIELVKYHPLKWYKLGKMDNRTHRKLLIIDGQIGFTGGVGIADNWQGHADSLEHWRDSHFRLEGPAVAQMQSVFMDNWLKSKAVLLDTDVYFPALKKRGDTIAQVFKSAPGEGSDSVQLMFLISIAAADKNIRIASAYFVPDDRTLSTLEDAAKRGVKIEIIVPGKEIDQTVVRKASRALWGDLLKAGVKIYEYQPTMFHCKVMIVDDIWVSVGSTNFDNRSFELNDEANLNIYDNKFAREQIGVFEKDKEQSTEITYQAWKHRPIIERMVEHFSSWFRSEM
jgi:cardiolipin synthase